MPGLDTAYLHKLAAFIFPRELSVGNFGIELIHGALVGSSDKEDILFLNINIISNTFCGSLDSVL